MFTDVWPRFTTAQIVNNYTPLLPLIKRILGWPTAPELQVAHIWSATEGWRLEASYVGQPSTTLNARGEPTEEMALRALACRTREMIRGTDEEMQALRAGLSAIVAAPVRSAGYSYIAYKNNTPLAAFPTFYAALTCIPRKA